MLAGKRRAGGGAQGAVLPGARRSVGGKVMSTQSSPWCSVPSVVFVTIGTLVLVALVDRTDPGAVVGTRPPCPSSEPVVTEVRAGRLWSEQPPLNVCVRMNTSWDCCGARGVMHLMCD